MTLTEALKQTGIRESELGRINVTALKEIIYNLQREAIRFPYDNKLKIKADAYNTILNSLTKL